MGDTNLEIISCNVCSEGAEDVFADTFVACDAYVFLCLRGILFLEVKKILLTL